MDGTWESPDSETLGFGPRDGVLTGGVNDEF